MKPEPVQPLHGSILGAPKNCILPLKPKKLDWALSFCPSDATRSQAGMGCQSSPSQGRTKPWNLTYRWKSKVISPKEANLQLLSQHQRETTRAPIHSKEQSPHWRCARASSHTTLCLTHLGEPTLTYGCSSKSLTTLTQRMGGIFPDLQPQGKGPSRAKTLCGWSESVPGPLCPLSSRRDIVLVQPIRNTNHWHQNLALEWRLNQKMLCSTKKIKKKHSALAWVALVFASSNLEMPWFILSILVENKFKNVWYHMREQKLNININE